MSLPKYNARRDENEPDIIRDLNAIGWECKPLSSGDLPDLLCRHRGSGRYELLEVETGTYKRRRKKEQLEMLKAWQIPIVKNFDEAARALGSKIS
jgi:hypothetical protein